MAVPDYQTLMLPLLAYLADGSTRSTVPEIDGPSRHPFPPDAGRPRPAPAVRPPVDLLQPDQLGGDVPWQGRGPGAGRPRESGDHGLRQDHPGVQARARGRQSLAPVPRVRSLQNEDQGPSVDNVRITRPRRLRGQPEGAPDGTYESLRQAVEVDILDRLQSDALSWAFFEQLVVDVLVRMGFGLDVEETSRRVTRKSGDDGNRWRHR